MRVMIAGGMEILVFTGTPRLKKKWLPRTRMARQHQLKTGGNSHLESA
jgi:hypothetical protein